MTSVPSTSAIGDPQSAIYDVTIIGAGVVGAAIARELARYQLRCLLLEAGDDVGAGTSKANTAILHTGFDAKPGTLEAQLVRRGYDLLQEYGPEAGIPIERIGALLVAWNTEQLGRLDTIAANAQRNGYTAARPVAAEALYHAEPYLGPEALGALAIPDESIICPFTTPLAFATQAVVNGVDLVVNSPVQEVTAATGVFVLRTPTASYRSRFVINCAGLHADTIDRMFGHEDFS